MKVQFFVLIFFSILLLIGCRNSTLVSPPDTGSANTGSVLLKFAKTNTPQNVVKLIARLSNQNSDSLTSDMDLLTDSSATINFSQIPVGVWQLNVTALDSAGKTLYSGETEVTVISNYTTQVNLNLLPVNSGSGNVQITVNWGGTNSVWTDYSYNPIFTVAQNPSNPNEVSGPKVIFDNGIYKMWYIAVYNGGGGNIWYAESNDGINWTSKSNAAVLNTGSYGAWDALSVGCGAVIKDGNEYKMYYNGTNAPYGKSSVGLAVSYDGRTWVKYSNPVLTSNSQNEYHIGAEAVLKENGKYYMYYAASPESDYSEFKIYLATSFDGINWIRYSGNPILTPTLKWEGNVGVTYPSVIYENDQFEMVYESMNRASFGTAVSADGLHWEKKSQNPIFLLSQINQTFTGINYPDFIKVGPEYRIYYCGNNNSQQYGISFARSDNF